MSALDPMRKELDKTSVLSQEFKTQLLSLTQQAISEAYRRGFDEGRRTPPPAMSVGRAQELRDLAETLHSQHRDTEVIVNRARATLREIANS